MWKSRQSRYGSYTEEGQNNSNQLLQLMGHSEDKLLRKKLKVKQFV